MARPSLNLFSKKIKYLKEDGRPKSIVRTGSKGKQSGITTPERTMSQLRTYWNYYAGEGTIFASINSMSLNTVMVGYILKSNNPKAQEMIDTLCKRVKLLNAAEEMVKNSLIFGDSFTEKVFNGKKEISRLKTIDPRTMVVNSDEYGDIVDYQQYIGGNLIEPPLKPESIVHLKVFPIPGSPYGLSLLAPNMDTIDRKVATDESLFNAIQRHTAKYVISVGSEKDGQVPPSAVMDDIKEEFEDITSKNEFIVPWFIKIDTIDEKGVQGVREYFDLFQTQMIVGLMCPEEALGMGRGSTNATAITKAILYERTIKGLQNKLSLALENELFKPYLDENGFDMEDPKNWVYIQFNSVTEEDDALRAKWWGNILRGFRGQIPFTGNEFRAQFGLDPIEGLDELLTNESSSPSTPTGSEEEAPVKEEEEDNGKDNKDTPSTSDTTKVPEEDNTKE